MLDDLSMKEEDKESEISEIDEGFNFKKLNSSKSSLKERSGEMVAQSIFRPIQNQLLL